MGSCMVKVCLVISRGIDIKVSLTKDGCMARGRTVYNQGTNSRASSRMIISLKVLPLGKTALRSQGTSTTTCRKAQ
jgi:hypothetical protein